MEQESSELTRQPRQPRWRRLAPVWVNLLLGVPAVLPLHSAWLLLTTYRACAFDNSGYGLNTCGDSSMVEGAGWARVGVVLVGGLGLLVVLLVDVLLPANRGRRWRQWTAAALVIPVPYLLAVIAFKLLH
ncbi:hypothetical protein HY68_06430 [Streptomyces sp. AcH 505]|nr:hypothetical protein HY68_06430 [Streptomyces sp. AcH 505]